MKTKYYTYANMETCPDNAVIKEHKSYERAVKHANELTDSPVVYEAGVYTKQADSLVYRKTYSTERNPYSFGADDIDAYLNYTTPEGKVIKPPKEYHALKNEGKHYGWEYRNTINGIKIINE